MFLSDGKRRKQVSYWKNCFIQRRCRCIYLDLQGKGIVLGANRRRRWIVTVVEFCLFVSAVDFSHLFHHPIQLIIACHSTQESQQKFLKEHLLLLCLHFVLRSSSCCSDSCLHFIYLRYFTFTWIKKELRDIRSANPSALSCHSLQNWISLHQLDPRVPSPLWPLIFSPSPSISFPLVVITIVIISFKRNGVVTSLSPSFAVSSTHHIRSSHQSSLSLTWSSTLSLSFFTLSSVAREGSLPPPLLITSNFSARILYINIQVFARLYNFVRFSFDLGSLFHCGPIGKYFEKKA